MIHSFDFVSQDVNNRSYMMYLITMAYFTPVTVIATSLLAIARLTHLSHQAASRRHSSTYVL